MNLHAPMTAKNIENVSSVMNMNTNIFLHSTDNTLGLNGIHMKIPLALDGAINIVNVLSAEMKIGIVPNLLVTALTSGYTTK